MQKHNGMSHIVRDELDLRDYHFGKWRDGESEGLSDVDVVGNDNQRNNSVDRPKLLNLVGFVRSILA